jgi:hypothetical protein
MVEHAPKRVDQLSCSRASGGHRAAWKLAGGGLEGWKVETSVGRSIAARIFLMEASLLTSAMRRRGPPQRWQ